ncbi:MAG: hypothetical protein MJK10_01195 [Pseudomonadales bacterium]|nr:hypothetical protein [Pseudomonadales bacterium]NRA14491.1 hypothetical protein [Oceanospirillaceae bacterium]
MNSIQAVFPHCNIHRVPCKDLTLHFSACSTSGIRHYCKAKSTDKKTASERFFLRLVCHDYTQYRQLSALLNDPEI